MDRRYRLKKYMIDDIQEYASLLEVKDGDEEKTVLDRHLEYIYKKTDKVATTMEKYVNDFVELEKKIKDRFENEGISIEEYMRVTVALKIILNRLDDMEKHVQAVGEQLSNSCFSGRC